MCAYGSLLIIGKYPSVSLKEARLKRDRAKEILSGGLAACRTIDAKTG